LNSELDNTIYFHIGDGRCGSSAIQVFSELNRDRLAERGLSYPSGKDVGFPAPFVKRAGNGQALYDGRRDPGTWEALERYLAGHPGGRVMLSSEFLLRIPPRFHQRMVECAKGAGYRAVAVIYVRDQRDRLISRYAQGCKSRRFTMTLETYLETSYHSEKHDYLPLLLKIGETFGRENLIVRNFQRDQLKEGDVCDDIYAQIGVEVGDLPRSSDPVNASATVDEVEVMRLVNTIAGEGEFDPRAFMRRTSAYLQTQSPAALTELYRLVSPQLMKDISNHFAPMNEALRREFFPTPPPMFKTRIPEWYEPYRSEERISERSVLLIAHYFIEEMKARRVASGVRRNSDTDEQDAEFASA